MDHSSTHSEALQIFEAATAAGLTGKAYVWIVTQSVVGSDYDAPKEFPIGEHKGAKKI